MHLGLKHCQYITLSIQQEPTKEKHHDIMTLIYKDTVNKDKAHEN